MPAQQNRIFESETTAVAQCKYGPMMYLKQDMYIGRSLEVYGEWYEAELSLLRQAIKPGNTIVDIGANIGTHTVAFARMTGPQGFVLAFEPQTLLHGILSANLRMNDLHWTRAYNRAVGRAHGVLKIPYSNPVQEQNFGGFNAFGHADGDPIELIRLDDMGLTQCHLIKIDVEGAEADVLAGAENTIRKFRPTLFVESNKAETARGINAELIRLGYQSYWHFCHGFNPNNFRGVDHDIFNSSYLESNLFCIPQEYNVKIDGLEPLAGVEDTPEAALQRYIQRVRS